MSLSGLAKFAYALAFLTVLSGCVNVSMTCADKVSTVSYKGISLTGNTSVSCIPAPNGGYDIEVGGPNLLALAMAVAPLVAAKPPKAEDDPGVVAPDPGKNL